MRDTDLSGGRTAELPGFDGIRALAALGVFFLHANGRTLISSARWVQGIVPAGRGGPYIFFVTSAFLLYRPYASHHRNLAVPGPSTRNYVVSRTLRIFPAYWAALVLITVVFGGTEIHTFGDWASQLALAQVYSWHQVYRGIVISWTLSVEIGFYVVLPLYAACVAGLARRTRPLTAELVGIVVLFGIGAAAQTIAMVGNHQLSQYWLPFYLPHFAVGIAFAVAHERSGVMGNPARERVGRFAPLFWVFALLAAWFGAHAGAGPLVFLPSATVGEQVGLLLMAAFVVAPAVFRPSDPTVVHRFIEHPWLAWLGLVSYGLYLWHVAILNFVLDDVFRWAPLHGSFIPYVAVTLPASIALGALSFYALERPIRRVWRARLLGRRHVPPGTMECASRVAGADEP